MATMANPGLAGVIRFFPKGLSTDSSKKGVVVRKFLRDHFWDLVRPGADFTVTIDGEVVLLIPASDVEKILRDQEYTPLSPQEAVRLHVEDAYAKQLPDEAGPLQRLDGAPANPNWRFEVGGQHYLVDGARLAQMLHQDGDAPP